MHNLNAPPGPTYMPQYKLADQAKANALDSEADASFQTGTRDGQIGDDYVRITVFLAAVLFLVGIGSTFKLLHIRYALVIFGSLMLILAAVLILLAAGASELTPGRSEDARPGGSALLAGSPGVTISISSAGPASASISVSTYPT